MCFVYFKEWTEFSFPLLPFLFTAKGQENMTSSSLEPVYKSMLNAEALLKYLFIAVLISVRKLKISSKRVHDVGSKKEVYYKNIFN